MERRNFIRLAGTTAGMLTFPDILFSGSRTDSNEIPEKKVSLSSDGLDLSPAEYSEILIRLSQEKKIKIDNYSIGGVVEELEQKFASLLGKEAAIFMPTGTLANQIALRKLAGDNKRVIVQAESHIYNDTGDASQVLSGLNLIPLAEGQSSFSSDEVKKVIQRTDSGRVETKVGVISIESPVRRKNNEMFDFNEMSRISAFAKENDIAMHFDGARMFNMPHHSGKSIKDYAALFDTVYVSLYKCFNAASGAVLAGPEEFISGLYHTRRMFGGGLPQIWPFAAVALKYMDAYLQDYADAWKTADEFISLAGKHSAFSFEKIKNGTSVLRMRVKASDPQKFSRSLQERNILLPRFSGETKECMLRVNTSLKRTDAAGLSKAFIECLN